MDLYVIVLRLLHLFSGVFWVGTIFFTALFLLPRVKQAGPLGAQFMQRLSQPPLTATLSLAAGLVVLSGILLYWRGSGGLPGSLIGSPLRLAFGPGGLGGAGGGRRGPGDRPSRPPAQPDAGYRDAGAVGEVGAGSLSDGVSPRPLADRHGRGAVPVTGRGQDSACLRPGGIYWSRVYLTCSANHIRHTRGELYA